MPWAPLSGARSIGAFPTLSHRRPRSVGTYRPTTATLAIMSRAVVINQTETYGGTVIKATLCDADARRLPELLGRAASAAVASEQDEGGAQ
jgi:hypothetical protein